MMNMICVLISSVKIDLVIKMLFMNTEEILWTFVAVNLTLVVIINIIIWFRQRNK